MRRRPPLRGLLGVLVLVLAIAGALLSRGVADAVRHFRNEQAYWQAGLVAQPVPKTGPIERTAGALLGTSARSQILASYLTYRFTLSLATSSTLFLQTQARSNATLTISKLRSSLADPRDRARADVTLGVLYAFSAFSSGTSQRSGLLQNAEASFRGALREDPTNADAKYDLELLLSASLQATASGQSQRSSGNQAQGTKSKKGRRGRRHGMTPQTQLEGSGY